MNAQRWIRELNLQPHPEGGYYRETYRGETCRMEGESSRYDGPRACATAIYYLLEAGDVSAFHRLKSDEIWHFYAGDGIEIIALRPGDPPGVVTLGPDGPFQCVIPRGTWFGARVPAGCTFGLVGCTVAPGFDFADFEMARRAALLAEFPGQSAWIMQLTRD